MIYFIYFLVNKDKTKTYIGFTKDIEKRIICHKNKKVKSTKNFDNFRCFILEKVITVDRARIREKYWKSQAGRKKLKVIFDQI